MNFDSKENQLVKAMALNLLRQTFEETDILGFLILMRQHLDKGDYPILHDLGDFIAHRERNRGDAVDDAGALHSAFESSNPNLLFTHKEAIFRLFNPEHICDGQIQAELNHLFNELGYSGTKAEVLDEIALYIFSILQQVILKDKNQSYLGKFVLGQNQTKSETGHLPVTFITLKIKPSMPNTPIFNYAALPNLCFKETPSKGYFESPIQLIRKGNKIFALTDTEEIEIVKNENSL